MFYGSLEYDSSEGILFNNEKLINNLLIRAEEFFLEDSFPSRDEYYTAKATFAAMQLYQELPEQNDPKFLQLVSTIAVYQNLEYLTKNGILKRIENSYTSNE